MTESDGTTHYSEHKRDELRSLSIDIGTESSIHHTTKRLNGLSIDIPPAYVKKPVTTSVSADSLSKGDAGTSSGTLPSLIPHGTMFEGGFSFPSEQDTVPLGSGTTAGILGQGGMTRVYKIWNSKLEMFRAVKVPLPNGSTDAYQRFSTEMKISARLDHPHIVHIFSVGDWKSIPYIEMELIDGVTLEDIIEKYGQLPPAESCSIAMAIASALAYAHQLEFQVNGRVFKGVIHRDLKPANIMISKTGVVKLMDFGIARPLEVGIHTMNDGNIVGTIQYFSPEQIDNADLDGRTDIYALGTILYEMLTGHKAFPITTLTALIKQKMLNEYKDFDEYNFTISSLLKQIARKCLSREKNNRYGTAEELEKALATAYKSLSKKTPEKVLADFMQNPDEAIESWQQSPVTRIFEIEEKKESAPKARNPLPWVLTSIAGTAAVFFVIWKMFL